eukprot:1178029-Prorocentrum_minimum.AAC.6
MRLENRPCCRGRSRSRSTVAAQSQLQYRIGAQARQAEVGDARAPVRGNKYVGRLEVAVVACGGRLLDRLHAPRNLRQQSAQSAGVLLIDNT